MRRARNAMKARAQGAATPCQSGTWKSEAESLRAETHRKCSTLNTRSLYTRDRGPTTVGRRPGGLRSDTGCEWSDWAGYGDLESAVGCFSRQPNTLTPFPSARSSVFSVHSGAEFLSLRENSIVTHPKAAFSRLNSQI